jgi:hypothetical protein
MDTEEYVQLTLLFCCLYKTPPTMTRADLIKHSLGMPNNAEGVLCYMRVNCCV